MGTNSSHCLFVIVVALVLANSAIGENEWSGFVNTFTTDFSYLCPDDLAVSGIASTFSDPDDDRQWEFRCSSGGGLANVTANCTLQDPINTLSGTVDYDCPDDGYIAGFQSNFSSIETDRLWSPYCCTRPYSSLVNCHILTTNWENSLGDLLNWTTTSDRVLAGLETFYSAFNRDRRWRFRQCEIRVNCGDPGVPANAKRKGDSFLFNDTVAFTCDNGYYQSSGPMDGVRTCLETGLWSDSQPKCTQCTNIEDCADIRCSSALDHSCEQCDSHRGLGLGEAAYDNMNTSCQPLCSWLRAFCYPGVCSDGPSSCNCSEGFSGVDCLDITAQPELDQCATMISSSEEEISCVPNTTSIFVDQLPTSLVAKWSTIFQGPMPEPVAPAYVADFGVGVVDTAVLGKLYRATTYPTMPVSITRHECTTASFSTDLPNMNLIECSVDTTSLSNHTFFHGDRFVVEVISISGGHLDIIDLDTNLTTRHYYNGSTVTGSTLYIIDTEKPTHCSVNPGTMCLTNQDILSETLDTSLKQVTLVWGGWLDNPSSVDSYRIELYELVYDTDIEMLRESSTVLQGVNQVHTGQVSYSASVSLVDDGPYSIILVITDAAGNSQYARRTVLLDEISSLLEDDTKPLNAISGIAEGNAYWHNSTTSPIIISGVGHFYNSRIRDENWLAPVANYTQPIPTEFDDSDRDGTPNALGVVEVRYTTIVDQDGGRLVTRPDSFLNTTSDLAIESVPVSIPNLSDGDSVTIWFEARDFNSKDADENVLVHIDSSPPVVSDLGLVINGVKRQVLHGTQNLLDLNIEFQASDAHSGLYNIDWSIRTDSKDIGNGIVPVATLNRDVCLPDPNCICDTLDHCHKTIHTVPLYAANFSSGSEAKHDTDYYITITAMNNARLSSSITIKFTVDLTPPLSGTVKEGIPDQPEIDYQHDFTIPIYWSGFFDRETAIPFYQYIIATECHGMDSFQYPLPSTSLAKQTNETMISWTAPSVGRYYTTVLAYNGAFQPTSPVCSDGVTIDRNHPLFEGVRIPGATVRPGLVSSEGEVWLVYSNRERAQLISPTEHCLNKTTNLTSQVLSYFPIRLNGSSAARVSPSECSQYSAFSSDIYTSVNTVLNISWASSDNTGIRGYQFGLTSNDNVTGMPDILPMQTTAGHAHFSTYSSQLVSGSKVYAIIEITDLANHVTRGFVGPIIIDTSPPQLNGSLILNEQYPLVLVWWKESTFVDPEDSNALTDVVYALGSYEYGTDVLKFTPLPSSPHPSCPTPNCITIDTEAFQLLPGHEYHILIRVRNSAGLEAYFPVTPFTQPFIVPSSLNVFEIESNSLPIDPNFIGFFPQQKDIDILVDESGLAVGWAGLQTSHLNVSFSVALGTRAGLSNVIPFINKGSESSHTFINLTLTPGTYYYSTVRATSSQNQVIASSDGFLALSTDISGAFVWDGSSDEVDSDYLPSSSEVSARWFFPSSLSSHVTNYRWALFEAVNGNRSNLNMVMPYIGTGRQSSITVIAQLDTDIVYVSSVQACIQHTCLLPVHSNGFQLASHPAASTLMANYTPIAVDASSGLSSQGRLSIMWSPFADPELLYYQWAVSSSVDGANDLVTEWSTASSKTNEVVVVLERPLFLHMNYNVVVRGVNRAGLQTSLTSSLVFIMDDQVPPLVVYDIEAEFTSLSSTDDWQQLEHHASSYSDLEYTKSATSLSAAWPSLRYTRYNYSISAEQVFKRCSQPGVVGCGTTITNSLTVSNLSLLDGSRYYFCIRAQSVDFISPSSSPSGVTACSNGITVDLSPPQKACVQILPPPLLRDLPELTSGDQSMDELSPAETHSCMNQSGYQASTSVLHVIWDWFSDSEVNGNIAHAFGVSHYQYAIGTTVGGEDVISFTSVGVVREVVVTDLKLTHGVTYYATIKAVDHVGLSTISSSLGVTSDTSAPTIRRVWLVTPTSIAVTSVTELHAHWDLVIDEESEVKSLYWSLGSAPGRGDLVQWQPLNITDTSIELDSSLDIRDGQPIVFNLMATNGAGLSLVSSSQTIIYDSTPPSPGLVFDGPRPVLGFQDLDYTSDYTVLEGHWEPFLDPDTGVSEYWWGVGTCPNCTDVMPFTSIGLSTDSMRRLSLTLGKQYFITVRGCSTYSGCSLRSSNGITIDSSPPITAQLMHGLPSYQIVQFQASRLTISAHWSGFHDDQSGIKYYTYSAGINPDDDSFITLTTVPAEQQYFIREAPFSAVNELPLNRTVYVTVEAVNNAGLSTKLTSRGIFITDIPPQVEEAVKLNEDWVGSLVAETQYSSSAIRVEWQYSDQYSTVFRHYWSLVSPRDASLPLPQQTTATEPHTTRTNLQLADGDRLYIEVIGCNPAGLCTPSSSSSILVDSSPPIDGYFAIQTSTAASLPWSINNGMSWRNMASSALLNITFTGFSDPDSGISSYWAMVGTTFRGKDLYESTTPLLWEEHANPIVSTATITISRPLAPNETVYVSLWAVNGVGLRSHIVQGSFMVVPSINDTSVGQLKLLRSTECAIESCRGHCTCQRSELCQLTVNSTSCQSLTTDGLVVTHVVPQLSSAALTTPLFTAITDQLVANITVQTSGAPSPQWVEWSVGLVGAQPGAGVLDIASDPVWYALGPQSRALFTLPPSHRLQDGMTYVFYARAWYNSSYYSQVQSSGVTVDSQGVQIRQGRRTRETTVITPIETDFISSFSQLSVTWNGVFSKELSAHYSTYEIGIGESPGSDSVYTFKSLGNVTSNSFASANVSLQDNRHFYTTVRALSPLGILTSSISDGFLTDATPPNVGVVFDGLKYWDEVGQAGVTTASLRHFGFHDPHSYIHHYEGAITPSQTEPAQSEYTDIGIKLKTAITNLTLSAGTTYYSHIAAVSTAGVRSDASTSNGFIVDTTPPVASQCTSFNNLIHNGSFESLPCGQSTSNSNFGGWTSSGNFQLIGLSTHIPFSGCFSLLLTQPISQTIASSTGEEYSLSFAFRTGENNEASVAQVKVTSPGHTRVFSIYTSSCAGQWQLIEHSFTATSSSSTITIEPVSGLVVIDDVQVTTCSTFNNTQSLSLLRGRQSPAYISCPALELTSSWWMRDEESEIGEYMWAIGTSPGGEQLQRYTTTGGRAWGFAPLLNFNHNSTVYVSVVARNTAGLASVAYSDPVIADFSAPVVRGKIKDGGEAVDIDYQTSGVIKVDWSAIVDDESGIKECYWAIGRSPNDVTIQEFTFVEGSNASSSNILSQISHGTTLYSTVTCINGAGRSTTAVSDGVTILTTPPSEALAVVRISSATPTLYEPRDGFLPSDSLIVSWDGFIDSSQKSLQFQLRLITNGTSLSPESGWIDVGDLKQVLINNVTLVEELEHTVEVRAYLLQDLASPTIAKKFVISTLSPVAKDTPLSIARASGSITFTWTNLFEAAPTIGMYYEVSIGTQLGSAAISRWSVVAEATFNFPDARLNEMDEYFLSLTAIAYTGYSKTLNFMISGDVAVAL